MANILTSFYVPKSMSEGYVENKRDESGNKIYDTAEKEVGIQRQAALQELGQQYGQTINKAYDSYLANQRAINKSNLFQGYKDLYKEAQDEALMQEVAQTNLNAASARQTINENASAALSDIQKAKDAETNYLNKVQSTMTQYYDYLKQLEAPELFKQFDLYVNPNDENKEFKAIDDVYETLYKIQPRGYLDMNSNAAMSYAEWVKANLSGSSEDQAWGDWAFQGGINDFMKSVNEMREADKLKAQASGDLKSYNSPYKENSPDNYEGFVKDTKGKFDYREGDEVIDNNGQKYKVAETPGYGGYFRNNAYSNWKTINEDLQLDNTNGLYTGTILSGKSGKKYLYVGDTTENNEICPIFIKLK